MANTFDFLEIKFQELTTNINAWIKSLYNKSDINLTAASPYGHIVQAQTKIYESSMLYQKNAVSQFDILNPDNNNSKMVTALARVGGYDPSRAISATGTISLMLRSGVDISEIGNSELVILNGTKLNNNSNGLDYYIDLGVENAHYIVEKNKKIILPIVQGKLQTQVFTGTGLSFQSISIVLPNGQSCEQYRIILTVNGQVWNRVASLNDMLPGEKTWYSKSGIDGGLDIYFGTNDFGFLPPLGSQIQVTYVISDGSLGNLPSKLVDDFVFSDDVFDGFGASVDIATNFMLIIENEIGFGADVESVQFTKAIMPYISRNFVLARPEQYIFLLKRLGQFSQIDAFTTEKGTSFDNQDSNDDSVVYLFLVPNIALFLSGGNSYFDLSINAFFLENSEKAKVERWLREQGIMSIGTAVKILDPFIMRYVVNIHLRIFKDAIEDNIRANILTNLSNFFGNIERRGFIDKSGIIKIIEEIDGVDSVSVDFISEANETYHGDFIKYQQSILQGNPTQDPSKITMAGYEPDKVIGLDPILGDIVYTKNMLPIIRGGFFDRNGVFYQETPQTKGLSSVNIFINDVTSKKLFS